MEFKLKELEIQQLVKLRNHKRRFLIQAIFGFLGMAIFTLFAPLFGLILFIEVNGSNWLLRHKYQIGGAILLGLILYKIIDYFYIKPIIPLNNDIKQQVGIIEKHQIIQKQHFPITNDHFFFFAEVEIPNIPVDALSFTHYKVGDYFTIHKAKQSKVVFEDIYRQEVNTDYDFEDTGLDVLDHFPDY